MTYKFDIGDKVKCLFGNSGNKFWDKLREELVIEQIIRNDDIPDKISFSFDPNKFFYANDFELVSPKTYTKADMANEYKRGFDDGCKHTQNQVLQWRKNRAAQDYNTGMF